MVLNDVDRDSPAVFAAAAVERMQSSLCSGVARSIGHVIDKMRRLDLKYDFAYFHIPLRLPLRHCHLIGPAKNPRLLRHHRINMAFRLIPMMAFENFSLRDR